MELKDEFTHKLKNGSEVVVSAEAWVYRDEFGQGWIEDLEMGFSIVDTRHYEDAVKCLGSELGAIKARLEDRLMESHDEAEKEAS
jgi:hypothetical protein